MPPNARRVLSKRDLMELYVDRQFSLQTIAEAVGVSRQTVRRLARAYGISLRPPRR